MKKALFNKFKRFYDKTIIAVNKLNFRQQMLIVTAALIIISSIIFIHIINKPDKVTAANKINNTKGYTYYFQHYISPGETLWDIAEKYNEFEISNNEYIRLVREINNMGNNSQITYGNYIIIPIHSKNKLTETEYNFLADEIMYSKCQE